MNAESTPNVLGPRDFSRLLQTRFGLKMSHQAISKAPYLAKSASGQIVVTDALAVLADRGRIRLDAPQAELSFETAAVPAEPGRPRAKGNGYYDELTLTERVKRRKLELSLAEDEGKLLRIEDVTEAMVAGGRRIGERIERLTGLADELAAAGRDGGTTAVRDILRREARAIRESLAEALSLSAAEEPDTDGQS